MMEKADINWLSMSDVAIMEQIGRFIKDTRIQQNKTQEETAEAAGLHRTTLSQIENGSGGTLLSIIQILRVLGQLHLLQQFQVSQVISPLKLAQLEKEKRQRASRTDDKGSTPKSDW